MPAAAEKVLLTDRFLNALKPVAEGRPRRNIWDAVQEGLVVQVGAKGRASLFVVGRIKGAKQPTWRKLGEYPALSLADARDEARVARKAFEKGEDPKMVAEAQRRAEAEAKQEREDNTFGKVVEQFNVWYATTPSKKTGRLRKTAPHVAATIEREFAHTWGERPIADITERDVTRLMNAILRRGEAGGSRRDGGPNVARHAFQAAGLVFAWARKQRLIAVDPTAALEPGDVHGRATTRDRVLSDDELRRVWLTAEAADYPYGPLIRLLILTGARRDEIAAARWSEIRGNLLAVRSERMKGGVAHTIPLTSAALAIVEGLPRFEGKDAHVFSTTGGRRPIAGFSKAKVAFDRSLGEMARWTLHDLRRTCRTGLSSLGVLPVVAEMVIGRQQQGISKVYDLHRYDREKREALERWEARVLSLISPDPEGNKAPSRRRRVAADNVVPLRRRART
jgi:integrase